jgi:hypothetical protein
VWKGYDKKRPQTLVRLTRDGRQRFVDYLSELERVIRDAHARDAAAAKPKDDKLPPGWVLA